MYFIFISHVSAQDKTVDEPELILRLDAKYNGSIGWGDIYKCRVTEIKKGNLKDSVIYLYIVVNNYDSILSKTTSNAGLTTLDNDFNLVANFKIIENDLPYINFRNAFIDQNKRTWLLIDLKNDNKP